MILAGVGVKVRKEEYEEVLEKWINKVKVKMTM